MDLQYQQEHYGDDQRPQYLAGLIICVIVVSFSVSVRLYAQYIIGQIWRWDNWLVVIAAVRIIPRFHTDR